MSSPQLYIFVALGLAFSLSWVVSKFSGLPIDLLNTSIGLLFGASANLSLMANLPDNKLIEPALIGYAILLVFLQFWFGILIVSTHFAHRNLLESRKIEFPVKIKEAIFYSSSSIASLFCCYVMAVFFLHSTIIFAPVQSNAGEIIVIMNRWLTASNIPTYVWIIIFVSICIVRYWREQIYSISQP